MSSFYDDASLVVIPSGYKTSKVYSIKPTDGSGDMSFSRSNDTASRIAPNGLIEKVRTNLALYSEDFTNAYWVKSNASVTANTMANPINGALTADTITMSAVTGQIYVNLPRTFVTSDTTISFFIKNNGADRVQLLFGSLASLQFANFNLVTGTITGGTYGAASITPLTNGFFRISLTAPVASTAFVSEAYLWFIDSDTAPRAAASTGDGVKGVFAFGAQLETDVLTDYIGPTLGSAVSVGPVANVPRLDYLNSSCPRLLLEPQRTNLATFSESFDNAAWTKSNATVTANTSVSPDGYTNADTVVISSSGYILQSFASYSAGIGQKITISVFAKNQTNGFLFFGGATPAGTDVYAIESYGNGWYRHSVVRTFTTTTTGTVQYLIGTVGTHIIWGAQVEGSNSAYATSYIPTLGAAVTRGADAASKTSASALIGQTEGTIVLNVENNESEVNSFITLSPSATTVSSHVYLGQSAGNLALYVRSGGTYSIIAGSITSISGIKKVALAYGPSFARIYVNGAQVYNSTAAVIPSGMDKIEINSFNTSSDIGRVSVGEALIFKTILPNSDLAALTA